MAGLEINLNNLLTSRKVVKQRQRGITLQLGLKENMHGKLIA